MSELTDLFEKPSKEAWLAKVKKDLKGEAIHSLDFPLAGRVYSPFHHLTDRPPGTGYVMGMPDGHRLVGIEIDATGSPAEANAAALDALNKGADLLLFRIPSIEAMGKGTRKKLLKDILTDIVTIVYVEPLFKAPGAPLIIQEHTQGGYHVDGLSGDLADALYSAMESYVEDGAKQPSFHVPAQEQYFLTIAQLRALRLCWQRISAACGEQTNCRIFGHIQHKSGTEANHNKIVATTHAMALTIGGADGLVVAPSDHDGTNAFTRRVALNLQHVIEYESHLQAAPDPAAGSYFLEQLTNDVAQKIWTRFQALTTDSSYQI